MGVLGASKRRQASFPSAQTIRDLFLHLLQSHTLEESR